MKTLYLLPFLFLAITTFAQKQFVVQNGTAQTFDDINVAIAAANAGDTIYLPGGGFNLNPATIEKTLHWRGVGHYPDSTVATGSTQITTYDVYFSGDCDNSTFEGIHFQHNVRFGTNGNECTGVTMKRCRVAGTLFLRSTDDTSSGNPDLAFHISECVTSTIQASYGMNVRVEKTMIFGVVNYFVLSYFNHCSVNYYDTSSSYDVINYCENCQFLNSVFSYSHAIRGSANCNFENNIFAGGLPYDPNTSTFTGSGNITSVSGGIYNTITGNVYSFSYANNYHLNTSATGKDEDGQTVDSITGTDPDDGTNAGVYGTLLPYKNGAVPYAPHIQSANIDNEASGGNLGVQIKVAAQSR
ncbi:hypothetical protein [uncultured Draconibacterium sp.]|uniref:hypothetical protein n=1 Tax=uncultured Draconibacterium sp. TaxID=1573823 RepID=UPI002AA846DC|nr:hypothetical protein [uncultured Draconibacterium sp.]